MIVVLRCTEDPAVPSRIVHCSRCGNDCWLSDHSGDQTIALAKLLGDDRFVCMECIGLWDTTNLE